MLFITQALMPTEEVEKYYYKKGQNPQRYQLGGWVLDGAGFQGDMQEMQV